MNIKNIKNKVKKAIASADFSIDILYDYEVDDGVGGVIDVEEGKVRFNLDCVIDNSKSYNRNKQPSSHENAVKNTSPILVCLYDEQKMPREGDYFIIGNKRYTITYVDDVLQLQIYLQCALEVVLIESTNEY